MALVNVRPNFQTYGLGWFVSDYRGHKIVYHSGALAGFVSRVTLMPDQKLGIIVLTNQEATGAHQSITATVLDHYLQAPPVDWVSTYQEYGRHRESGATATVNDATSRRNPNSKPSLALHAYAGRYRDAWYGDVRIEENGGNLSIAFTHTPRLSGMLEHWQYDTFIARWHDRSMAADAYVTFALKPDGTVDQIKMEPVSPLTDFSYDFQDLLLRPVAPGAAAY
jgi:hypothetical protein